MSVTPEEVVTQDTAPPQAEANTLAQAPVPEANGSAPATNGNGTLPAVAASPVSPPAPTPVRESGGMSQAEFEDSMFKELSEGDVVTGTVVHIDKDGVLVDVGSKSEGVIRPNELSREPFDAIENVVKVNESVKVVVIGRTDDGTLLLSKKRADFEKAWDKVIEAMNAGTILHAMVSERVKGGLVVDLGIRGFIPASHVGSGDFKHQNLDKYVGQSIPIKVIEVDRDRRKVVLSNRLATQEEREQKKQDTLTALKEGDVKKGIVRRVTDYGAFVDLGGIDGLLHVSEMSWARIKHPSEVVHNGQELDVIILKLRLDEGRISLGLRQILPDPWTQIGEKYNVGDLLKVRVSRLVPFGAFVELEEGVEAIIPNSELSDRRISKPGDVVNPGDEVEARVIEMRTEERKMTLSIRRAVETPTVAREPYVPEPEIGGRGRSDRDSGGRGEREGERDGGIGAAPRSDRRPRRESGGGGGGRNRGGTDFGGQESEEDYREFKNFRASQREETFGTSLADLLGDRLSSLTREDEAPEAEEKAPDTEAKE